jgi:uncharacterized protein
MRFIIAVLVLPLLLVGCATTHDSKVGSTLATATQGNISGALAQLDKQIAGGDKTDLLLNLEKGELLRIDSRYQDSLTAFEVADSKIRQWEEKVKSNPAKVAEQVGALLAGDLSRSYEGQDYEKVMLTTRMAMNRIHLGDLDTARVDIKRTHEREAIIAEFRAKEAEQVEQAAKEKGAKTTNQELNGYPIETLNDPEVLKLKNGYQNALSHYLAGFVYEVLQEPGLAAPGYRKAIELRPNTPLLNDALRGLDKRVRASKAKKPLTDVLFVIETGNAPARQSHKVAIPVPTPRGLVTISFAYPSIHPDKNAMEIAQISLGKQSFKTALIADFNVMARRALKDEMPGIQARAAVRAVGKALIQDQANRQFGVWGGLLANVAVAATEANADDRMWRSLPGRVFIARGAIAPGEYELKLPGQTNSQKITVAGRHMIVPVRLFKEKTYYGEVAQLGVPVAPTLAATPKARRAKADKPVVAAKPAPDASEKPRAAIIKVSVTK